MRKKIPFCCPKALFYPLFQERCRSRIHPLQIGGRKRGRSPEFPKRKNTPASDGSRAFGGVCPGNRPRRALPPRKARTAENIGGRAVLPGAIRRSAFVRKVFRRKIPKIVFYCINIHLSCSAPAFRLFPGRKKAALSDHAAFGLDLCHTGPKKPAVICRRSSPAPGSGRTRRAIPRCAAGGYILRRARCGSGPRF